MQFSDQLTGCNIEVSLWFDFQAIETTLASVVSFNSWSWHVSFHHSRNVFLGDFGPKQIHFLEMYLSKFYWINNQKLTSHQGS